MTRWLKTIPLRTKTLLRKDSVEAELHEEMRFHLDSQVEQLMARGYDEREAKELAMKAIKIEREMEQCRDERAWQGWEKLKADIVFGWRQLKKRKVTTAAAVLSLGLAVGSCMAAFQLIDALFLHAMPVHDPKGLYFVSYRKQATEGQAAFDSSSDPFFEHMRDVVRPQADAAAAAEMDHIDVTYGPEAETEKAYRQWISGDLFSVLGLQPAAGRLLTAEDDRVSEASPYAVISYDYWTRRFGRDPGVVGKTFHMRDHVFEIVGVAPKGFTGTEPGTMTDLFAPIHMEPGLLYKNSFDVRVYLRLHSGVQPQALQSQVDALFQSWELDRLGATDHTNNPTSVVLEWAGAGASNMQKQYSQSLEVLGVLVLLVLLIACANVANLMTAQSAARAREMALRMSLGAGRKRLVRLVLVESAMVGLMAMALGLGFAAWATPFVVSRINPANNPARFALGADWMVIAFGLVLTMGITLLFGLRPALRASAVQPASALKGGDELRSGMAWMQSMIAAQVAFCFVVLFLAGLFTLTFAKLLRQPLGFTAERLIVLDTVTKQAQPATKWLQMAETLKNVPGVQAAALEDWALLSGTQHNEPISIHQQQPGKHDLGYTLGVSPGWLETMRIPLLSGRDLRDTDTRPGNVVVNEAFAKKYFNGANPIGQVFETRMPNQPPVHYDIVGLAKDIIYKDVHQPVLPQIYYSFQHTTDKPVAGTVQPVRGEMIVVRTNTDDPAQMSETLRRAVTQADLEFRVSTVTTQQELFTNQTLRERLLASLAGFFGVIALLLAVVGLYGVLHYSVVQREKEIGIRLALGAAATNIARVVTVRVIAMVCIGAVVGLAGGLASVRFVETLLYGVKGTDLSIMVMPLAVLLAAAIGAAAPVVVRATRIDPVRMLRAD